MQTNQVRAHTLPKPSFYTSCCCSVPNCCLFVTPWTVAHHTPLSSTILDLCLSHPRATYLRGAPTPQSLLELFKLANSRPAYPILSVLSSKNHNKSLLLPFSSYSVQPSDQPWCCHMSLTPVWHHLRLKAYVFLLGLVTNIFKLFFFFFFFFFLVRNALVYFYLFY